MKTTRLKTGTKQNTERTHASLLRVCLGTSSAIRDGIENAKQNIVRLHAKTFEGQERLLALALNEAEAVAWHSEYPHLVFPELALEKAAAAVSWQRRQKIIQGNLETAFAA